MKDEEVNSEIVVKFHHFLHSLKAREMINHYFSSLPHEIHFYEYFDRWVRRLVILCGDDNCEIKLL